MSGMRVWRLVLVVLVALPVAAVATAWATIDPNAWRPQIAAAARRASGRDVALNGPIALTPSLWPTLSANDVVLTGHGQTIAIGRVEARFALLPLLARRVQLARLVLVRPRITLSDAEPGSLATPVLLTDSATPRTPSAPTGFFVGQVRIEDGEVRRGAGEVLTISRLDASASSATDPVAIDAALAWNGTPFTVKGEVGALQAMQQAAQAAPWPLHLTATATNATLAIAGTLADPLHFRGYDVKMSGTLADTAALGAVFPVPPLHDVTAAATLVDSGTGVPTISDFEFAAGAADLGRLKLDRLSITAPRPNQPTQMRAAGSLDGVPVTLAATLAAPITRLGRDSTSFDATVTAATARASVKGRVAVPATLGGLSATISAAIPDLAALAPIAHGALPALKDIVFAGTITTDDGGIAHGAALHGGRLNASQADVEGDASFTRGTRPSLQATLSAKHIDLDALLAALPPPQDEPVHATTNAPATPQSGSPAPARSQRLIPDTPIPVAALRRADAAITLHVDDLQAGGATAHGLDALVHLADGKLSVEPLSGQLPGGRMEGSLHLDAAASPPAVDLVLRAPGLAFKPVLRALGLPDNARGALEVDADLHGTGDTLRAVAASLDGHLGLAMVDGAIDNRLLEALAAPLLRSAKLPGDLVGSKAGSSAMRCLALRLDSAAGIASVRALLLDMALLRAEGSGTASLRDETLDLRLKPLLRMSGTGVMVPLRVGGTWLAPKFQVDAPAAAGQVIDNGSLAGGKGGVFTAILGALTAAPTGHEACGEQLALARGGRVGPMPADPPPGAEKKPPKPVDLLRQLFR